MDMSDVQKEIIKAIRLEIGRLDGLRVELARSTGMSDRLGSVVVVVDADNHDVRDVLSVLSDWSSSVQRSFGMCMKLRLVKGTPVSQVIVRVTKGAGVFGPVRCASRIVTGDCKFVVDMSDVEAALEERLSSYEYSLFRSQERGRGSFDLSGFRAKLRKEIASEKKGYDPMPDDVADQVETDLTAIATAVAKAGDDVSKLKRIAKDSNKLFKEYSKRYKAGERYLVSMSSMLVVDIGRFISDKTTPIKDVDAELVKTKQTLDKAVLKFIKKALKQLLSRVGRFCKATGTSETVVIEVKGPDREAIDIVNTMKNPTFYVVVGKGSMAPGFTVFARGSNFVVDDVLDVGDPDFFPEGSKQETYFNLVEYMRSGKLPQKAGEEKLKLYRWMSDDEYEAWRGGERIPTGKFFTSSKKSADIAGPMVDRYVFTVDGSIVRQTDQGTFQLIFPGKLTGRGEIVPA